jgi:D-serine deaminase-like pyridoxal phosphate-dependent protein
MTEIGKHLDELDTPTLWVDLDRLERNIGAMVRDLRSAGVNWRPHIKGIKVPAIAHKMVNAGAIGVTCGKLGEAEVMVAAGIRDILIANQIVGPHKSARLAAIQRHANVKSAVDNEANVVEIAAAARRIGTEVGLVIELDTGMHRAGVAPGQAVLELARFIQSTDGVRLAGLMTWEGHNLALSDLDAKHAGIHASIGQLIQSVDLCRNAGIDIDIVSGGGSGTYVITSRIPGMTEIQAGGAIFCDQTYQAWGVKLEPALFLRTRVTSRPVPDRLICDAGFKTHTRGFNSPNPVGFSAQNVSLSAEHGIITLPDGGAQTALQVGDCFDMTPGYGDATVFLHDTLYGVRNQIVETVWDVQARGKLR